jgi:hypothetical protein
MGKTGLDGIVPELFLRLMYALILPIVETAMYRSLKL